MTALAAAAGLVLLVGAGWLLIPSEKEHEALPVMTGEEAIVYDHVAVGRGDLVQRASVACYFQPLYQEHLSFEAGGLPVSKCYVQVGDKVKEGQLLAELRNEELDKSLENARERVERLTVDLEAAGENTEIVRDSWDMYRETERYERAEERLREDLETARLRLEELEQQKSVERIFARFEGTVTSISSQEYSISGADFIVVSDLSSACYYADTEYHKLFQPGMKVTLTTGSVEFPATVTTAQALGVEDKSASKSKPRIYFVTSDRTVMENAYPKASLELELESRENVLIVPSRAVFQAGGQSYVYYENENGVRDVKPVELGLGFSGKYEVLSGVTEGEILVLN